MSRCPHWMLPGMCTKRSCPHWDGVLVDYDASRAKPRRAKAFAARATVKCSRCRADMGRDRIVPGPHGKCYCRACAEHLEERRASSVEQINRPGRGLRPRPGLR